MAIFSGKMDDDMLMGTMEDDVLWGGMGNDTLSGGAGDDRLIGGPGRDALDGGEGSDTADYAMSDAAVHVDLTSPFDRDDDDPGPVYGGHAEGDSLQSIENIWGSGYSDELVGNHVSNMLFGRGGNDKISGMQGGDSIWGGAGADVLMGNDGDDVVFGGSDDDLLQGGDGDDILMGQAGNDLLEGGDGDDILEGGAGADELDGGKGSDTAAYTMSAEGVTINLSYVPIASLPEATGGDATGDEFKPMTIENVRGSMHDDKLTGDGGVNKLYGNMGDDMLMGGAGNDMLRGGKGDDELEGGDGDDTIRGDKGDDTLTGDDGADTFWLMKGDGDDTIEDFEPGVDIIKFGTATQKLSPSEIRDILDTEDENRDGTYTYEWEDVSVTVDRPLSAGNFGVAGSPDNLTNGNDRWPENFDVTAAELRGPNVIHGLDGNDVIRGDDGDDMLSGNAGNDRLMGEDDDDTLNGGRGNDTLEGGDDRDVLMGGPGNDTLSGNRHNDTLTGGTGDDTFWFGRFDGHDTITDFSSGDEISLGNAPLSMKEIEDVLATVTPGDDGYTYNWGRGTAFTVNRPLTEDDFEKAPAKEKVMLGDTGETWPGTGVDNSGDDTVYGGDGNDVIDGGAGDDMIDGMDGDDMLDGGAGMDTLTGGAGNDTFQIDASSGSDVITDFRDGDKIMLGATKPMAAVVDGVVSNGGAQGPNGGYVYTWMGTSFEVNRKLTADDFEMAPVTPEPQPDMVSGTWPGTTGADNTGNDFLQGSAMADTIMGGRGNDTIDGGDGDDAIDGGGGNDEIDGGAGYDQLQGDNGDDMVYADADDVSTIAADGSTTRAVGTEIIVEGGAGEDTLSFARSMAAVNDGAARATTTDTPGAHTAHATFENVVGSSYGDMLTLGFAEGGSLMGGAGNDALTGAAGNDTIDGGAGNDTISGLGGADMLTGGANNDTLTGGAGNDTIAGGGGDDSLSGGTGVDRLDGGAGRDTLTGGDDNDVFVWGHGDIVTDYGTGDNKFDTSALGDLTATNIEITDAGNNVLVTITVGGEEQWMVLQGVADHTTVDITDFLL